MNEFHRRTVSFSGARSGVFPCTWGQRDVWREVEWSGNPAHGNVAGGGFLPRGYGSDELLAALRELLQRYESLRTRFTLGADGELVQHVLAQGEIAVEFGDLGSELAETVRQWAADIQAEPYDLAGGIPFRVRVGMAEDEPRVIIFGMPHMAADFLSTRVFFDELLRVLRGRPAAEPAGLQPVETAEQERSARGQRALRRSLDYWRWAVEATPPAAFDTTRYEPEQPRYRRGCVVSRAVPEALDRLAARYEVGTSHVLLAAMAVLLGRYTGLRTCLVRIVVGNRGRPDLRNAVGTLTQETVAVVDLGGRRFGEVVRNAWSTSLQAMRHGHYEPESAAKIVSDAGAQLDVYFNDMWTATRGGKGAPVQDEIELGANTGTTFRWGRSNDWASVAFFLESAAVLDDDAATELSLLADTACVPLPTIRTFLFAIEELLTTLADSDDRPLDEIDLAHDPCAEPDLVPDATG